MYHRIAVGESAWLHDIGHGGDEHPAINQFRDVDGVFATTQELEDFVIANDRPGLEGHGLEQRLYGVLDSMVDVSFPAASWARSDSTSRRDSASSPQAVSRKRARSSEDSSTASRKRF